jgi:hypothetical protein
MEIASVAEAEAIHDKFFPHDALAETAKEVVQNAFRSRT